MTRYMQHIRQRWQGPAYGVLMASMMAFLCYGFTQLTPTNSTSATAVTVSEPESHSMLSDADSGLYKLIFAAQQRGEFTTADAMVAQLHNPRLIGYVLAERYLTTNYKPTSAELSQWLTHYADHPQAGRVARLASSKGITVARLEVERPLKGDGYIDHLGRSTLPDEWYRGLSLWRERNYSAALPLFKKIGANENLSDWQRAAGYYWASRSAGKVNQRGTSSDNLELAAQFPKTFYGLLAAQQIGNLDIRAEPPEVSDALREDPRTIRATLLASIGRTDDAEDELRHLYSNSDESTRGGIVTLASEMNLANFQVRLARTPGLTPEQATFANYPMPSYMLGADQPVDAALLLAVARNESGFRDVRNGASGATGMMQMLPSTARAVERHVGRDVLSVASNEAVPQSMSQRLSNPEMSVRFGAHYLKLLLSEPAVKNDLIRLLAGYNAGPGAVAGWQSAARKIDDPLLYIESIPYPETRNYVMQVMAQYWVYQSLLGQEPTSLATIAHGQWAKI